MRTNTPFIDESGNMKLHAREGGIAMFEFKDRDMTGAEVSFETQTFQKDLTPGETSSKMVLTLQPQDIAGLLNKSTSYIILDKSGAVPHVIIQGKLIVEGWT